LVRNFAKKPLAETGSKWIRGAGISAADEGAAAPGWYVTWLDIAVLGCE
jgi:hypothetical protein